MATTQLNLVPAKYMEDSQTNQFTSSTIQNSTVRTLVDKCTILNLSSTAATFSLNLLNTGDSASNENLLVDERRVEPGEFYDCPELVGQVLIEGQAISTIASAANTLSLRISGREVVT